MRRIESRSEQETYQAGRQLGQFDKPGEIYCLNGDL